MPRSITAAVAGALVLLICSNSRGAQETLLSEDFEGLNFGSNVQEQLELGVQESVWTDNPPTGWSITRDLPGIGDDTQGTREWEGWSFAKKEFWVDSGELGRSQFSGASGGIAIADTDLWADLGSPAALGRFSTVLTTPAVSLEGIGYGSDVVGERYPLHVQFTSSWLPGGFDDPGPNGQNDNNQTAILSAAFDGLPATEVLHWDSDLLGQFYHPQAGSEAVSFEVPVPYEARSIVLNFSLLNAGDDGWWAIDNVLVTGFSNRCLDGDLNCDGKIDLTEFGILKSNFGKTHASRAEGDVDGNGKIDLTDFGLMKANFGKSAAAAPEPATWLLALLAALGCGAILRSNGSKRLARRSRI